MRIQQLDLLDEAIQPEPHRGVADAIPACQLLHGPGSQHEPLDEPEIFLLERVNPPGRRSAGARPLTGRFLLLMKHGLDYIGTAP